MRTAEDSGYVCRDRSGLLKLHILLRAHAGFFLFTVTRCSFAVAAFVSEVPCIHYTVFCCILDQVLQYFQDVSGYVEFLPYRTLGVFLILDNTNK